jgi:hypothetical protein
MSTNLIYNGNFLLPSITANTTLFYTSFTTEQANSFYWTCAGSYVAIINGYIPSNNIPDPSLIGYSQYGYDISAGSLNNVIYPSLDPSVFEVKYPTSDIQGRVVSF